MDEYIKKSIIYEQIKRLYPWNPSHDDYTMGISVGYSILKQFVVDSPAADVDEVVRCKDCKYGEVDDEDFSNQYNCNWYGEHWNEGEHFCSHAKRREATDE